jgi:hypothetical protein
MEAAMLQRLHFLDKPSGCNGLAPEQSPAAVHHVRQQTSGNWPFNPGRRRGTVGQKGSSTKPDRIGAGIAIPTETMRTSLNEPILPNDGGLK